MARIAVVSGGTRGIGAQISQTLKNAGYTVIANYASNDQIATDFARTTGISIKKWSVNDYQACVQHLSALEKEYGSIDVLVNNAGITRDSMFHKMTLEQWKDVIDTNLSSLFYMSRTVWEGMRTRRFGRIVNISSVNGQRGQIGQVNYSAAKAGDLGFTRALAQEGAAFGITVNAICPGYIATEMVQAISEKILKEKILPQIPIGRLGTPQEIARAVLFLVSDEAQFMTGSTLSINGGQWMS